MTPLLALLLALPPAAPPAGTVDSVGLADPVWDRPCVAVLDDSDCFSRWPPSHVAVGFRGYPGRWPVWAEAGHPDAEGRHRAGRLIDGAMRIEGGYRPTGWGDR